MLWKKLKRLLRKNKPAYLSMAGSFHSIISLGHGTWAVSEDKPIPKPRKIVKPIEVFKSILRETPSIDLTDLDKKIRVVKSRMKALKDHMGQTTMDDELIALQYLTARKKFVKNHKLFNWPTTTSEIINKLCEKYELKMSEMRLYYKTVPQEGVDEMTTFAKAFEKITGADPIFKIIVDDDGEENKKDPILLAESPFGRWYYVLGAWDKEVEIVDDIIYKGK